MKIRFIVPMLVAFSIALSAFAPAQKKADDKMAKGGPKVAAKKPDGKKDGKSKKTPEQKAAWDKAHPRDPKTGKFIKKADVKKAGPARDAKGRFIKKSDAAKPGADKMKKDDKKK